jgi:uncharacterized SAM-binding protein YcdF (DUF218 family)
VNSLFAAWGALGWKPLAGVLLMPPVPLLALLLLGLWLRRRRLLPGLLLITLALAGLWLAECRVTGDWLQAHWLRPPPTLNPADFAATKRTLAARRSVVLVLGGGLEVYAPEYGEADLSDRSHQRLSYGLWLGRKLDLPVMFAGGIGRAQRADVVEATVAARVAEREQGRALRWLETQSADTRGNARASLPILAREGLTDVLLVTHTWHMPRALRAFQEAADLSGAKLRFLPAPVGAAASSDAALLDWLPSNDGHRLVREVVHEVLGLLAGA